MIISHLPTEDYLKEITWTGFYSGLSNGCEVHHPLMHKVTNAESLVSGSDALIITGTKGEYYNLAVMALKHAKHLFMPVTLVQTVAEANKLIKLASEANVILKVYKSEIFPHDFNKNS